MKQDLHSEIRIKLAVFLVFVGFVDLVSLQAQTIRIGNESGVEGEVKHGVIRNRVLRERSTALESNISNTAAYVRFNYLVTELKPNIPFNAAME